MKKWRRPARPEPKAEHCCARCEFCLYDKENPARLGLCGNQEARRAQKQTVLIVKVYLENKCPQFHEKEENRGTAA